LAALQFFQRVPRVRAFAAVANGTREGAALAGSILIATWSPEWRR
jgi:hypothetical protein